MSTSPLTKERRKELAERWGSTDDEMRSLLSEVGFKDLDNEVTLVECANNTGYLWSFKSLRWFNKNQPDLILDEDAMDYATMLDEIRAEEDRLGNFIDMISE